MAARSPRRVVVVDDEEGVLRLCERVLQRANFDVVAFRQPYAALDYLQHHRADVLVVDTRMPSMDGFALMEQARLLQPSLAVVIMSLYDVVDMAIEALNHGADGVLIKPFERATLVQSVWQAISHRHRQEETARMAALRPLFEVTEALIAERRLKPLQKLVVQKVGEIFPSSAVGLYLWENEKDTGRVLASAGKIIPPADPIWNLVPSHHRPWRLDAQSANEEERAFLEANGWMSMLIATVLRDTRRYAVLVARDQMPLFHEEVDATALGILARLAATALESARLYEELRDSLQQLERSQRALAQAEKMAAIGRLTASLAHEVNNPIQAIRNSLYLASHPNVPIEQQRQYIQSASQEVERLSTLVHRMLNFYRPGNAEYREVQLAPLLQRVITLLAEQMHKQKVEAIIDIPENLPPVNGIEDQLQQVILNLVLNALEAMENGGCLFVWGQEENGQVALIIEDTGPGIPPDLRDRIFEPLISTKESGTGLGLAVSYSIIADHNGQLSLIEPVRGTGAAFKITLPGATATSKERQHDGNARQHISRG